MANREKLSKRPFKHLRWIRYTAGLILFAYIMLAVLGEITHAYEHKGEWQAAVLQITSEQSSPNPHITAIAFVQPHPCPLCLWQANNLVPCIAAYHPIERLYNRTLPLPTFSVTTTIVYLPAKSSRSPPPA